MDASEISLIEISFLLCGSSSEHFELLNAFITLRLKSSASSCKRMALVNPVRISSSFLSSLLSSDYST